MTVASSTITQRHLERLAVVLRSPVDTLAGERAPGIAAAPIRAWRACPGDWLGGRADTEDRRRSWRERERAGARGGFREMCALIARAPVGGFFGIEGSRLARNTMEWFQLLDLCRRHDTVLLDDSHISCSSRADASLVLELLCGAPHNSPYVVQPAMLGSMSNPLSLRVFSRSSPDIIFLVRFV